MNIENKERRPIFEVDGYPVFDSQIIESENSVTCSFLLQMSELPTPEKISFRKLMENSGGSEILKKKKWMNEQNKLLIKIKLRRECLKEGPDLYRLKFTYLHEVTN